MLLTSFYPKTKRNQIIAAILWLSVSGRSLIILAQVHWIRQALLLSPFPVICLSTELSHGLVCRTNSISRVSQLWLPQLGHSSACGMLCWLGWGETPSWWPGNYCHHRLGKSVLELIAAVCCFITNYNQFGCCSLQCVHTPAASPSPGPHCQYVL